MINSVKRQTYGLVEVFRIPAAVLIIQLHISGSIPGSAGLLYFTAITTALAGESARREDFKTFAGKRISRLIKPWIIWFAIYLLINLLLHRPLMSCSGNPLTVILGGPWIALWFLPYAFFISLLVKLLTPVVRGHAWKLLALAATTMTYLVTLNYIESGSRPAPPWAQWLHVTPAVLTGLMIIHIQGNHEDRGARSYIFFIPLMICPFIEASLAIPFLASSILCFASFRLPFCAPSAISLLSSLTLGVYLSHGALITFFKHAFHLSPTDPSLLLFTTIGAFSMAYCIKGIPYIRSII